MALTHEERVFAVESYRAGGYVPDIAREIGARPDSVILALEHEGLIDREAIRRAHKEGQLIRPLAREWRVGVWWLRVLLGQQPRGRKHRNPQDRDMPRCRLCGIILDRSDLSTEDGTETHPPAWVNGENGSCVCWMCWEEMDQPELAVG